MTAHHLVFGTGADEVTVPVENIVAIGRFRFQVEGADGSALWLRGLGTRDPILVRTAPYTESVQKWLAADEQLRYQNAREARLGILRDTK